MDWLDRCRKSADRITSVSYTLQQMAKSFESLYSEKLANELFFLSETLDSATKIIDISISEHVSTDFKRAEETSATILRATLAGIELERRS